jgi:hypothetical protein
VCQGARVCRRVRAPLRPWRLRARSARATASPSWRPSCRWSTWRLARRCCVCSASCCA